MKIHLRQLKHGSAHFSGEVDTSDFGLEQADARALGPVVYDVDAGVSGGGLWVAGKLRCEVELCCVKTLRRFPFTVEVPDFAVQIQLDGRESIDLTPMVREDIFLNLPPYPKCDTVGATDHPAGSEDLLAESEPSEDDDTGSVWSALDELKPDN